MNSDVETAEAHTSTPIGFFHSQPALFLSHGFATVSGRFGVTMSFEKGSAR
jgi:hypothetical protein